MTVFKKELRAGMVSFLIWSAAVGGLMAMCVWMYPSFAGSMDDVSALFAGMEGFSSAFGMDKLAFGSIMGFYGVECGNIMGLGGAFFAALTGMGLLAGEEGGHTAEFLLTHPVPRLRLTLEKLGALAALVLGLNLIALACGAGSILAVSEDAAWGDLLRFHAAQLLMQLEIGGMCFGLSSLLRRSSFGIALGLVVLLYALGLFVNLDAGLEPLKFLTPYYYADAARVFSGEAEALPVTVSGTFAARVRDLIPDYVLDSETPRVAVVTLFQSGPFTLQVGDLAQELEIGGTYVFEIEPREDLEITAEEYEGGAPFADEAISRYELRIAGFRAAREDEFGLDSSCIVFEKRD